MELTVIGLIVIATGLMALYTSYHAVIYGVVVYSLFGCALALGLGGIGVLPAQLFLAFFTVRAFNLVGSKRLGDAFALDKPGFWLLCNCMWGVVGAIILPRLLRGSTLVFPVDRSGDGSGTLLLQPLGPVSGNLSQAIYCISDVVVYCCMFALLKYRGTYRALATAFFWLTFLDVLAGVIDIASHAVGIDVLTYVKTAQFAMLTGVELGGLVRISGTFSEASSYAGFTVPLFVFCLQLWVVGYRKKIAGALAISSGLMLLLSTSGTAYVGLGGYLLILLFSRPGVISRDAMVRKNRLWIIAGCGAVLGTLYVVLFLPAVVSALSDFFNSAVMDKAGSDSGIERMSWNNQGITNFIDTFGIGVGLGSIRASSFIVVLLSNLGVVGVVCYGLFIGRSLLLPVPAHYPLEERAICFAARHGVIATLICASSSAGVFELGTPFYVWAAAAGALSLRAQRRTPARDVWIARGVHE